MSIATATPASRLPATRVYIYTDLADGEKAYVEPGAHIVVYDDEREIDPSVVYIQRKGDVLVAYCDNDNAYAVSGLGKYEMQILRRAPLKG
ncbi:hypothetical protein SH501x_000868 [Pirellulaceae bacterium SH501]